VGAWGGGRRLCASGVLARSGARGGLGVGLGVRQGVRRPKMTPEERVANRWARGPGGNTLSVPVVAVLARRGGARGGAKGAAGQDDPADGIANMWVRWMWAGGVACRGCCGCKKVGSKARGGKGGARVARGAAHLEPGFEGSCPLSPTSPISASPSPAQAHEEPHRRPQGWPPCPLYPLAFLTLPLSIPNT
jgi:hypothetical protein